MPSLSKPLRTLALTAFGALALFARAEDIDIFSGSAGGAAVPNILVVIDSSSNWSATLTTNTCNALNTKFGAEVCALQKVADGVGDKVRLGLMMFTESGDNGAYIRFAMRNMTDQNKTAFKELLGGLVPSGSGTDNSGSNQPYAKAMFEAFKYFGGYTNQAHATDDVAGSPIDRTHYGTTAFVGGNTNNTGTFRRDAPNNNTPSNRAASFYNADSNYAFTQSNNDVYTNPITDGCAKNFIIFISNGNPSTGGDSSTNPARDTAILSNLGVQQTCIPNCSNELHASKMDEMAKFLNTTDVNALPGQQKVITYTIAVYAPQASGQPSQSDQQMINLMQSAAAAGGGKYCAATTAAEVAACIFNAVNEVQAVNSVFVSASLPVSVNTQGTYLNQVYMGMFRPDATGNPRWLGNLKQYKISATAKGDLFLADSLGAEAINPGTGFVSPIAQSFWTSASTYWTNSPSGTPVSASDLPDGEVVEKGGAGERVRVTYPATQTTRRVYTCPAGGCSAGPLSTTFDTATISGPSYQSAFGAASAAELTLVVNWIRGQDNAFGAPATIGVTPCDPAVLTTPPCAWNTAEFGPGWSTTVRPSVHGDVLHSRPVVLNYSGVGPYIFYGANDGTLRGTKGGRLGTDGAESWSFVAPEFFGRFKRLRNNSPGLLFSSTPIGLSPAPLPKDYFFDGPIGSYQSGSTAWIYVTARRGGRVMYAFDVSTPTSPRFMWKVDNTMVGMAELGQTWSEPKVFKVKASADPVIMFGAGYDPGQDASPAAVATMGRGIFVLNARTGALIRFFKAGSNGDSIDTPVPSDVAVIDQDFDTFADRAYVGDMAGKIWRMDIDDVNPASWKLFKLADVSPRKFFFRPDVVITKDFDMVMLGSGDREKPSLGTSTDNFYMFKDMIPTKDASAMVAITSGGLVTANSSQAALDAAKGWYYPLAAGEKVVNAPLAIGGIVYFSTNKPTPPAPGVCSPNLGEARAYALDLSTGGAGFDRNGDGTKDAADISIKLTGGGLPPSPVGGVVQLDDGKLVDFIIGGGARQSSIEVGKPTVEIPRVRRKLYWTTDSDK